MSLREILPRVALFGLTVSGLLLGSVSGQTTPLAGPEPEVAAESKLEISDVESQISKVESSGLDATAQDSLKGKFAEVVTRLKAREKNLESAAYFRNALVVGPSEVVQIQKEIEGMPSPENSARVDRSLGVEELRKEVDSTRAVLAELGVQLAKAESELVRVRGRPVEIGVRLPQARIELADADAKLKGITGGGGGSSAKMAEQMAAQAEREVLVSEVEMLSQEQLSQSVRESRRLAQRDLLQRNRENKQAFLAALGDRLKQQMVVDTEELEKRIEILLQQVEEKGEEWDSRLKELGTFASELKTSGQELDDVSNEHRELEGRRDRVRMEYLRIQEQVKLGAIDGSFSQVLMRQLRRLPNPRPLSRQIEQHEDEVRKWMLSSYLVDERQREQSSLVKKWEGDASWQQMLAVRKELLSKLRKNYGELVRESARFEADERAYRNLVIEFQKYLSAKLFWQKSSPLLGASVIKDIPPAIRWTFSTDNLGEFGAALRSIPVRQPASIWVLSLVVVALLVFRRHLIRSIDKSGKRIKKISTDRYSHTLRALFYTILCALPIPLVAGFIGLGLLGYPEDSDWVRGIGQGLIWISLFLLWALTLSEISRPGGLGEAHLNWPERSCKVIRRAVWWLVCTYAPLSLLASVTVFEESAKHFDSAGRLFFVLAHLSIVLVIGFLFSPTRGLFSNDPSESNEALKWRFRWLWYPLMVIIPLGLMVLAWIGYLWTALVLSLEFQGSLRIFMIGVIIYGLLVRWFTIRQRRIALSEALEARKARREQAEKSETETEGSAMVEVSEEELELDDVFTQTRRLLRVVVSIAMVVMIWFLWTKTLPIDRETEVALNEKGLTWLSILQLVLLTPISIMIIRNLPGLMNLAGLRSSGLEPGTRYALTTLCQYVITAMALMTAFKILDLDWSQFGWIAAALSVGLGFGLQEVVANFVCGIIILFERPVRIGDVVSLSEVTGTVTRIRMRATTITDWDRKDFIVPNKEFITGSLMNWTLSSPVNRLVIPVGVAYGSDTRVARDILIEIAEANSMILEDPKPIASFEAFADSTLNLTLRCYLPNMDNRLRTRTELCEAIDERFKEEGIEIAFPQQDVHLRGVIPSNLPPEAPDSSPKA